MKNKSKFLPLMILLAAFIFIFIVASGSSAASASVSGSTPILSGDIPIAESRIRASEGGGGTWTSIPNISIAVKQVNGGAHHNGFIFIPGGVNNDTGPILQATMQSYDITNNRWRIEGESMPTVVADAAICKDNAGKIHVINGFNNTPALTSSHMIYDINAPAGSRWSSVSAPQVGGNNYFSQASGCAVIDRTLYLFGGYGHIGAGSPSALNTTWVWDRATDTWSDTGFTLNTARYFFGYTSKTNNAYVAGGYDSSGGPAPLSSTERFTPGVGWVTGNSLPMGLLSPGLVGIEAGVTAFGGASWDGSANVLQPATYLCDGSCPPAAAWNNLSMNLNNGHFFAGYAGGPPDGPYVVGGRTNGTGAAKTAERLFP